MRFLLLSALLSGCLPQFTELQNNTDRVWLISQDRRAVWRCMDLTPKDTPYQGHMQVVCKEASFFTTAENPIAEQLPKPSTMQQLPAPQNQ